MNCRISDLRAKEVVNLRDGSKLGNICDIEIDTDSGRLISMVIYGKSRAMGLLGREDDIIIPWSSIDVIGDDAILVNYESRHKRIRSEAISRD